MKIVVDANIILSALIARGSKQDLLFSDEIEAISPDWMLFEVGKHWKELGAKTGFSGEELSDALSLIREQIKTFSLDTYADKLPEAKRTSPDIKDAEYLALALKQTCAIWSHDKELKQQTLVKVYNTKELLKELDLA